MSGRYLLDTNVLIALFAGEDAVVERLSVASDLFVPSIALGELHYGAQNSSRVAENMARIERLRNVSTVLSCDAGTASQYGDVKFKLKQQGTPIPENDIWIAAIALQYDLVLVTRDRHFDSVTSLEIESW
jgi:tRNA(fMet)-specific endonuclease VapC